MLPISIGKLILDADFVIAWLSGLLLLILFSVDRFNEPVNKEGSFAESLVPKHLADGTIYIRAFLIYVFIILSFYTLFSLLGPNIWFLNQNPDDTGFSFEGISELTDGGMSSVLAPIPRLVPAWVPLAVVLAITGASTQFKILNIAERLVRKLTHRIIGIPQGIERLASKIENLRISIEHLNDSEIEFLFTQYSNIYINKKRTIKKSRAGIVNKNLEGNEPLRKWLRLLFLIDTIDRKDLSGAFDRKIIRTHRHVWNAIRASTSSLRGLVNSKLFAANVSGNETSADRKRKNEILEQLDATLHDLHALIAACIAAKSRDRQAISKSLNALGLSVEPIDTIDQSHTLNVILLSIVIMFSTVLVTTFAIRANPLDAVQWALAAISLHGSASIVSWRIWHKKEASNSWKYLYIRKKQIPTAQYLKLVLGGFVAGTLGLSTWWFIVAVLTGNLHISLEQIWIPAYSLTGSITSFWVAYTLDLSHRTDQAVSTRRKTTQVILQSVSTGMCAYFVMITLQNFSDNISLDIAIQAGFLAAVAGATIGTITVSLIAPGAAETNEV